MRVYRADTNLAAWIPWAVSSTQMYNPAGSSPTRKARVAFPAGISIPQVFQRFGQRVPDPQSLLFAGRCRQYGLYLGVYRQIGRFRKPRHLHPAVQKAGRHDAFGILEDCQAQELREGVRCSEFPRIGLANCLQICHIAVFGMYLVKGLRENSRKKMEKGMGGRPLLKKACRDFSRMGIPFFISWG